MNDISNIDVIVVGAGPAGIAAALEVCRAGKTPLVIERGFTAGSKNMFGGAIYLESIKKMFPESFKDAPYERFLNSFGYSLLTNVNAVEVEYKKLKDYSAATVFRAKFDSWMMDEAKKEGVFFAPSTVARELIIKDKAIVGIKTDFEEIYAPITILAEGVNSILTEQAGLKKQETPKNLVLAVKETLKIDRAIIEERFNIEKGSNNGAMKEFFGGLGGDNQPIFGLGFLYVFKDYVSIGLGVSLEDLSKFNLRPYDLLDELKTHPSVAPLIEGGQIAEYSAHLIPEGGYNSMVKLYSDGVMVVGDAANFVNSLHFEGTNLAIESGILAGQTAVFALDKNDFSSKTLKEYDKKLRNSFVFRDLKSYRSIMHLAQERAGSIFKFYPKKIDEFFDIFVTADNVPKNLKWRAFLKSFFFERCICELVKDMLAALRGVFEVLK